jgi:hypothetical protein
MDPQHIPQLMDIAVGELLESGGSTNAPTQEVEHTDYGHSDTPHTDSHYTASGPSENR